MRPTSLHVGSVLFWTIQVQDPDTQVLIDADELPEITVRVNGEASAFAVMVSKQDATIGLYDCYLDEVTVEGDQLEFDESVLVTGSTVAQRTYNGQFVVRVIERGLSLAQRALLMEKIALLNTAPSGSVLLVGSGDYYCTRTDVELIFGRKSILKWADLDSEDDEDFIANRITTMIALAHEQTNDALRAGSYDVPVVAPIPTSLTYQVAALAGVLLYESRGEIDSENEDGSHRLTPFRRRWTQYIRDVLGQKVILSAAKSITNNSPFVS